MLIYSVKLFGDINCTHVSCIPTFDHVIDNSMSARLQRSPCCRPWTVDMVVQRRDGGRWLRELDINSKSSCTNGEATSTSFLKRKLAVRCNEKGFIFLNDAVFKNF